MSNSVHGIHHVTAIAGDAQENLNFYVGVLGMRLVKKSVNQDDPGTYHLFYADGAGVTGEDVLRDLAARYVAADAFADRFAQPEIVAETRSDFALAQALGIGGFPAVVLADDEGYRLLTMGYQPFEALRDPLEVWLAG